MNILGGWAAFLVLCVAFCAVPLSAQNEGNTDEIATKTDDDKFVFALSNRPTSPSINARDYQDHAERKCPRTRDERLL